MPRVLTAIGAERQGCDILYQRGAVELAGVDNESLRAELLERIGHVGHPQELTRKEQRNVGRSRLLANLAEQLANLNTIGREGTDDTLTITRSCTCIEAHPPTYY